MTKIKIGVKVRDTVTGYTGTATKRLEELHATPQIAIQRLDGHGTPEERWFVEPRVEDAPDRPGPGIHR